MSRVAVAAAILVAAAGVLLFAVAGSTAVEKPAGPSEATVTSQVGLTGPGHVADVASTNGTTPSGAPVQQAVVPSAIDEIPGNPVGDANGDTNITIADAQAVANYVIGGDPSPFDANLANVTRAAGGVGIADAQRIAEYTIGATDQARASISGFVPPESMDRNTTITGNATVGNVGGLGTLHEITYRVATDESFQDVVHEEQIATVDLAPAGFSGNETTLAFTVDLNMTAGRYTQGLFSEGVASDSGSLKTGLIVEPEYAGGNGTAANPYRIANWTHLDNVRVYPDANFTLVSDLNESTAGYEAVAGPSANGGNGFVPLGTCTNWASDGGCTGGQAFTGSFDGAGHALTGLTVERPDENGTGLFGHNAGTIENLDVAGEVSGNSAVGGLAGYNDGGDVTGSHTAVSVAGHSHTGGLVGHNDGSATVTNASATGDVTGNESIGQSAGGLIGESSPGTVVDSYATGNVSAHGDVGGLIGTGTGVNVTRSYATGSVTGDRNVGGLLGRSSGPLNSGGVSQSYATGNVTGGDNTGGLIGWNERTVAESYATGAVEGSNNIGGLIGTNKRSSATGTLGESHAGDGSDSGGTSGGVSGSAEAFGLEGESGTAEAIVTFSESAGTDSPAALQAHASEIQEPLVEFAEARESVTVETQFWLTNAALVTVDTDSTTLRDLLSVSGVESVVPNAEFEALSGPTTTASTAPRSTDAVAASNYTYGLEQINVPEVWERFDTMGAGASVAVLDTGVDADHPDLTVTKWQEFDGNGDPVNSSPNDGDGHGTHVSGTVTGAQNPAGDVPTYGVAPEADLYAGKVLGDDGSGTFAQIIAGMEWAVQEDVDVISMSLGAGGYYDVMIEPVRNAISAGTTVVASSGNSGEGTSGSPGNVYDAISVGAANASGGIASFSSGEQVSRSDWSDPPTDWPSEYVVPSVSAPGVDVLSSVPGGGYDGTYSGTSMAAPHVSGAIALAESVTAEDLSPSDVEQALERTAFKPEDSAAPAGQRDTRYGSGIVDALRVVEYLTADYVRQSYATGDVDGNDTVGGFIGLNALSVGQSYATGSVESNHTAGGLVGANENTAGGAVNESYWDTNTTRQANATGVGGVGDRIAGLTTDEMQGSAAEINMSAFDFASTWSLVVSPDGYPVLEVFNGTTQAG